MLNVEKTKLEGVVILEPRRFQDERGFFSESWNKNRLAEAGIELEFVQDNHSLSRDVGTVRGLHYQTPPHAQDKLVRCGRGRILDVAVDIRRGSPTFKHWVAVELSFENGRQLLVPKGFAHGFVTLEPDSEIIYKCTDFYAPECDRAIQFDDPEIAVEWGITRADALLSDKDRDASPLSEHEAVF